MARSLAVAGLVTLASCLTFAQAPAATTRVLTVTYADGFATSHVLGVRSAPFLAPGLAPVQGPRPSRPETPVTSLRLSPRLQGGRIDVLVEALGPSRAASKRTDLGAVTVGEPADLRALTGLGVQGLTFAVADLGELAIGEGRGLSGVRGVDLIDEPGKPGDAWRVEIQNRSRKPIRSARVVAFAAGRAPRSVVRRGREGAELMNPMEGYRPDLGPWAPHNLAIVTAVTWMDGTMAGDIGDGIDELMLDAAERVHVARVVAAIRDALALPGEQDPVAALKSAAQAFPVSSNDAEFQAAEARLPIAEALPVVELRQIMDSVLKIRRQEFQREVDAALSSRAARGVQSEAERLWLQRTADRYSAWLAALTR